MIGVHTIVFTSGLSPEMQRKEQPRRCQSNYSEVKSSLQIHNKKLVLGLTKDMPTYCDLKETNLPFFFSNI